MLIKSRNGLSIFQATSAWVEEEKKDNPWVINVTESGENWTVGRYRDEVMAQKMLDLIFQNSAKGKATDLSRGK